MGSFIYAYTDESGNTGNNLFDDTQPWFWTGTLLSKDDLDILDLSIVEDWKRTASVGELHAKVLGLRRIEGVAWR